MKTNFKKIVSGVLLLAMVLSVVAVIPVSASALKELPDATENYTSGVYIACRTIDNAGNETDPVLYAQDQEVIFELKLLDNMHSVLAADGFNYTVYADGNGAAPVASGFAEADEETGIALVKTRTMKQPGYLRLVADVANDAGETLTKYRFSKNNELFRGGVLVDVQNITMYLDKIPADELRSVWDEQLADQVAPTIEKITKLENPSQPNHDTYAIYIASKGNVEDITRPATWQEGDYGPENGETWAAAYLTIPTNKPAGSLDIVLEYMHYGVADPNLRYSSNAIHLSVCAHSVELMQLQADAPEEGFGNYYTKWIQGGSSYGCDRNGVVTNDKIETAYFANMLLRDVNMARFAVRAFSDDTGAVLSDDYDETQPRTMKKADAQALIAKWKNIAKPAETREVTAKGDSQGGFRCVGVAALCEDITFCRTVITWMADIGHGDSQDPTERIPSSFRPYLSKAQGEARSAVEYCDAANLAQLITCRTEVATAGLGDLTSPPTTVIAMYNNLVEGKAETDGPFSITMVQGRDHTYPSIYAQSGVQAALVDYSKSTTNGAFKADISNWSIEGKTLTVNGTGIIDAKTGDELWEADPAFANVDSIIIGEGIISLGANLFELAAENVTLKLPGSLRYIADNTFGEADLANYTIRSYNDTYGETYAARVGAEFLTFGDVSSSGIYSYTVNGDTLNLVSTGTDEIFNEDSTLIALATANAERIKNIEIEGKFKVIGEFRKTFGQLTRLESVKIDTASDILFALFGGNFADAANLVSFGHVEFDAVGDPIVGTGTYKKNVVSLEGFNGILTYGIGGPGLEFDGLFENCRAIVEARTIGAHTLYWTDDLDNFDDSNDRIGISDFENCISLESVTIHSGHIAEAAFKNNSSLKTVYIEDVKETDTFDFSNGQFEGTGGFVFIVENEAVAANVQAAIDAAELDATVAVGVPESAGDKTGAAGANATWKIKGSTLVLSGNGAVTKLEGFEEADKADITNIVVAGGVTAISDGVIAGFTLDRVSLKGTAVPTANDGVFGVQGADFVVYVTPEVQGVGATLYGYTAKVDGAPAGDINNDGVIDAKDSVVLAQVLAEWTIEYNANAADCNGDGTVDAKDSVLLAQYLADWDVELGVSAGGGDVEIPGGDLFE